jgi:uncharacterized protein YjbJ (UPF0337 family)
MRTNTKDNIEGTKHQVSSTIKEVVGKVNANRNLEIEGRVDNLAVNIRVEIGQINTIVEC